MKKNIIYLLILIFSTLTSISFAQKQSAKNSFVFISLKDEFFHALGCSLIDSNSLKVQLIEAKKQFTACDKCSFTRFGANITSITRKAKSTNLLLTNSGISYYYDHIGRKIFLSEN